MNSLVCMVGLPRSGKSTHALKLGGPIVSPDAIRLALHGQPYLPEAEDMVWSLAMYMVKSLFIAGHSTVIVDATNMTRKRRDVWVSTEWSTSFIHMRTPEDVCLHRAEIEAPALIPIIERMAESFEDFQIPEMFSRVDYKGEDIEDRS